ncbi:hypothetical protein RJ641_007621 [Dillenia turbinata]|uniref:Membrane-associated kinase regulator 6 n=1 Tax=Dillenia turbinata TaxID=194707 RepID=A0AAN8VE96_9MAGN
METSQPLSIESFSYSWLINLKPSFEDLDDSFRTSLDASDEALFIEMDPRKPPSKRFLGDVQDFKFDFPASDSPVAIVHADEIFSNGLLMPLFVDPMKMEAYDASDSISAIPSSSPSPETLLEGSKIRCASLRRYRKLYKRLLHKYLKFVTPFCQRLQGCGSSSKTSSADSRRQVVKNWVCSPESSPRTSVASACDWRMSCDSESSIYEAVLHCKRSIEKYCTEKEK